MQCCFTSMETIRPIRDGEPRTAALTFTQLLSSDLKVQCCFTSTETVSSVRNGSPGRPPRLSHSSWALGKGKKGSRSYRVTLSQKGGCGSISANKYKFSFFETRFLFFADILQCAGAEVSPFVCCTVIVMQDCKISARRGYY